MDRCWQRYKPSNQLASRDSSVRYYKENVYATKLKQEGEFIKRWCYSFSTNSFETKDEYDVSSSLLKKYVDTLVNQLGENITSHISKFLEEHVFPHETEMCFYLRKNLPCYDQSMNTPHEGHNNGTKISLLGPRIYHSVVRSKKK